jgi:hypothetical protein
MIGGLAWASEACVVNQAQVVLYDNGLSMDYQYYLKGLTWELHVADLLAA